MERRTCLVYSTSDLSPRAFEVLKKIKEESGYGDVQFVPVKGDDWLPRDSKILVFGSQKPNVSGEGIEYVHTYSIPQMMSKANALTVIGSALDVYFGARKDVPENFSAMSIRYMSLDRLEERGVIDYELPTAIDIETSGNLGVTHTPEDVEILTVAIYQKNPDNSEISYVFTGLTDPETVGTLPLDNDMLKMLAECLPKFTKGIYHNGKFDTRVLNRVLSAVSGKTIKLNVWFDTMLAHHVLNHAAGMHGLKPLCQMYFGAPEWEHDLKKYTKGGGHYELIPAQLLVEYNGYDVFWTYTLWEYLYPQIDMDEHNQMAFELEMQAAKMLLDVEVTGIPFHGGEAADLRNAKQAEYDHSLKHLAIVTGKPEFNPNSPKQVKEALASWGITVESTNEATLNDLLAKAKTGSKVANFIKDMLKCRKAKKIIGTYVDGWAKHERNGRVRPTFQVHGTSTGRLSSTAPNAQNVPRDKEIRRIVTLYEGNSLG